MVDNLNFILQQHTGQPGDMRCSDDGLIIVQTSRPVFECRGIDPSSDEECALVFDCDFDPDCEFKEVSQCPSGDGLNAAMFDYLNGRFGCEGPSATTVTKSTVTGTFTSSTTSSSSSSSSTSISETSVSSTSKSLTTVSLTTTSVSATSVTATTLSATETTPNPNRCPTDCCLFFDGCNFCPCENGFIGLECRQQRDCRQTAAPICVQTCVTGTPVVDEDLLAGSGTLCFTGTGQLVTTAPLTGSFLRIETSVQITPGTSGYIMARSTETGARYFSLYVRSRNRGINFYYLYESNTGMTQGVAVFSFNNLQDGLFHDVVCVVDGVFVTLFVDGVSKGTQRLRGLVQDCGENSATCLTHIGQRQGGLGLTGCIAKSTLEALPALSDINLLDSSNHDEALEPLGQSYCFNGASGLQVNSFPAGTTAFKVQISVAATSGSQGYLVSKGAGGTSRYWSLFLSSSGQVLIYYRIVGSTRQRRVTVSNANIAISSTVSVEVTFNGNTGTYSFTRGSTVIDSGNISFAGVVDDCEGPSETCTMHVGQRVGGLVLNRACLSEAVLTPRAV
eukprot:m.214291 g.214291  ORF g.214291 m.214291 type:complete len:562 (-) comp15866_c0_seq2:169-1854(-)